MGTLGTHMVVNKTKRKSSEWEKTFANRALDKGSISKIYKKFLKLNIKNKKKLKWAEDKNKHSSKEDIKLATNTWKIDKWKDMKKREASGTVDGDVNCTATMEKSMEGL